MVDFSESDFKGNVYEQFSRLCKALGSARRFELLNILVHGEHGVDALSRETGMSIANTSQHLQNLKRAGLVSSHREGNIIRYRLADQSVFQLLQAVRHSAESRLAEMDRLLDQLDKIREGVPQIQFDEMKALLNSEEAVLIDVRPEQEYQSGHLPQANCIPLADLSQNIPALDQNKLFIICDRDMYSFLADRAVEIFVQHGLQAARLSLGFLEWKSQGEEIVFKAI